MFFEIYVSLCFSLRELMFFCKNKEINVNYCTLKMTHFYIIGCYTESICCNMYFFSLVECSDIYP